MKSTASTCVIPEDSPNQIPQKLLQHQGCSLTSDGLQYGYFIEDLGEFPCLVVQSKNQNYATHHQRISIVQFDKRNSLSFLQLRIVTVGGLAHCLTQERITPLGISSWRYLPSLIYNF
jgi:hypothetical protein